MKIITRDNAHYLWIKDGLLKPKQKELMCPNCLRTIYFLDYNFFYSKTLMYILSN